MYIYDSFGNSTQNDGKSLGVKVHFDEHLNSPHFSSVGLQRRVVPGPESPAHQTKPLVLIRRRKCTALEVQ